MLVLPKLKGLKFKLLVMLIRVSQISLRGEEGVLLRGVILIRRRSFCKDVSIFLIVRSIDHPLCVVMFIFS